MQLTERSLLDEPNAALLDYLLTCGPRGNGGAGFDFSTPRTVLVFDFGGGTCDISILRVQADGPAGRLDIANLAIARYGQLGGDNIDAAIVEHVLLPQLLKQNGLEALDLSWSEKKDRILPQLLPTVEGLKLALCAEYRRELSVRPDDKIDRKLGNEQFVAKAPEEVIEEQRSRRAEAVDRGERLAAALRRLS
jgi:molecular chaperone DnaK (HSP70)